MGCPYVYHYLILSKPPTYADVYSPQELKYFVSDSKNQEKIEGSKAEILNDLFELDTRKVSRIMIPLSSISCLDINDTLEKNRKIILNNGHMKYPVIESEMMIKSLAWFC